jgi:hypothetical protein
MASMGRYCKAYLLSRLRAFPGWSERAEAARPEPRDGDRGGREEPRPLADDDIVYLQESLVVTDGIFLDEHVLFDRVTPEWEAFCRKDLGFEVPTDL